MPDLDAIARRLDTLETLVSIGGRTLFLADTNPVPPEWDHITKVDPEGEKQLPLAYPLYLAHTSAVSVGGSRNVTEQNTLETFDLLDETPVPAFHEPSEATHVTEDVHDRAEFMAVPEVLNGDTEAIVGALGKSLEHGREEMAPNILDRKLPLPLGGTIEDRLSNFLTSWLFNEAVFEAYIIMNVDSAAAREAGVDEDDRLSPRQAKQHAMAAEHHLESEVVYLEYSGTFGGEEAVDILGAVEDSVEWSRVWYGGGLDTRENARAVLDAGADAVVVGDIFHRTAAEEREHCEAAREALGTDAGPDEIEEWVRENVDIEAFSGTRYLSTITAVANPAAQARRYLVAAIGVYLRLAELGEELAAEEPGTLAGVERFVESRQPVADGNSTTAGDDGSTVTLDTRYSRRLAVSVLADAAGLSSDLPVAHLAVDVDDL
ncbi:heptaprenylglyceryl phosphate synthase [Halobacteriales archaeon SW_10_68_16]|jgi:phosphoglycerol geranylgeranyltransferase|nr:MAG: heptaprenylglyceryl phosphate synthase [Halobacteriales archaeon SW_10_68_16]